MDTQEKVSLFVLLRAFDRLARLLEANSVVVPEAALGFIEEAWACLVADKSPDTTAVDKAIECSVVDEQDAGDQAMYLNLYLYALADLVVFFQQATADSLSAAQSSIIDAYDYVAGQKYLLENTPGQALVLSDQQEQAIIESAIFSNELSCLRSDRALAGGLSDWARALEFR